MKPRLNVNSSDLETARNAALRARGQESDAGGDAPSYLRFTGSARAAVEEELHDAGWQSILTRCLEISGGSGILVMDENALIIAAEGAWKPMSEEQFEMLGPRLNAALDQATYIEGDRGPCRSIAIHRGSSWLTGIRVISDRAADPITIGLLMPVPLAAELQQRIESLVQKALY